MNSRKIVFSGIRATGMMHIGNYLGAIAPFIKLAENPEHDCFLSIADLHSLTTRPKPQELRAYYRTLVRDLLIAGIDPERITLFRQSDISETCELAVILGCLAPVGDLLRMHHFKDKREQLDKEGLGTNLGLLSYPVLMAADMLGCRATIVPVGDDQRQHLELARNIAERFNNTYGHAFPLPEAVVHEARVPSLAGDGKMSKSDPQGLIALSDDAKRVQRAIHKAFTDPARLRVEDPGSPEGCRVYKLHGFVSTAEQVRSISDGCRGATMGCGECKGIATSNINTLLDPLRHRRAQLEKMSDRAIDEILYNGQERARRHIQATLSTVKAALGLPTTRHPYVANAHSDLA